MGVTAVGIVIYLVFQKVIGGKAALANQQHLLTAFGGLKQQSTASLFGLNVPIERCPSESVSSLTPMPMGYC
jgi:hypothetical protein